MGARFSLVFACFGFGLCAWLSTRFAGITLHPAPLPHPPPAPPTNTDHDFRISRDDLLRYGNHSLTYRIVDRIFSQVRYGGTRAVHAQCMSVEERGGGVLCRFLGRAFSQVG